ncbi:MAG: GTP 3',8-cyclase MoaA [Candidatus Thermoplasmatota archaeon]|nr:GTP 3',8-cyclase MoaA [Candidatus Thermoplasmatota archaeon]MDI6888010.1 GTP 3',8-cyclase MoaA [Candidatus Thermoplasmatota archaeon]
MLKDKFGRIVKSLRISLTQRCNLKCFYCHNEGQEHCYNELSIQELNKILELAKKLDIRKVKFTGGEPLVREDIIEVVESASEHMTEISMTTNGTFLVEYAKELKAKGLKRVNISLDTLSSEKYRLITGASALADALAGVEAAYKARLSPIKLNMVLLKGINEDEIPSMLEFAAQYNAILQIIELEGNGKSTIYKRYHCDFSELERNLEARALRVERRALHNRKKYHLRLGNKVAQIELVKPMHNSEFCRNCTRIRITSDGKLKPCLFRKETYELASLIRSNSTEEQLLEIFKNAIVNRVPYWK